LSVLEKLAGALGRNDERPNVELAEHLARHPQRKAIDELIGALSAGTRDQQNDAVKVLYELGERRPEVFSADDVAAFLGTLKSGNNRLVWGGMSALAAIAAAQHQVLARHLPAILEAADRGSVIAKDKAVALLVTLAEKRHGVLPVLLERLEGAAPNQFPTYAEAIATVIDLLHQERLAEIIRKRLARVVGDAKVRRLEKLLRKLAK
jgi:hypothetical protein